MFGRRPFSVSKVLYPLLGLAAVVGPVTGATILADRLIKTELRDRTLEALAADRQLALEAALAGVVTGEPLTVTVDDNAAGGVLAPVLGQSGLDRVDLVRGDGAVVWSSEAGVAGTTIDLSVEERAAFRGDAGAVVGAETDSVTAVTFAVPIRDGSGTPLVVARAAGDDGGQLAEASARAAALRSVLRVGAGGLTLLAVVAFAAGQLREWRRNERHRRLALHDGLTGLANRPHFHQRLGEAVAGAYRGKGRVGLVLVDLDGFKAINDTGGHSAGDRLLLRVATKLSEATRRHELPCRIGGDEFAVIVPDLKDREELVNLADRLHAELDLMVDFTNGRSLRVTASMGLAVFPEDGRTPDDLVAAADVGMYRVKAGRKAMMKAAIGAAAGPGPA